MLDVSSAGEVLTLQRLAYVTEAIAHRDFELPLGRRMICGAKMNSPAWIRRITVPIRCPVRPKHPNNAPTSRYVSADNLPYVKLRCRVVDFANSTPPRMARSSFELGLLLTCEQVRIAQMIRGLSDGEPRPQTVCELLL